MEYAAYTVQIVAIGGEEQAERPEVFAYIDVNGGQPVVSQIRLEAPPGVSVRQAWEGLDLDQLAAALPKVGTALRPQPEPAPEPEPRPRLSAKTREASKPKTAAASKPKKRPPTPANQKWPSAPANILEIFATKYSNSYKALAAEEGIPLKVAYNWVGWARRKKSRNAELAALPVHDQDDETESRGDTD